MITFTVIRLPGGVAEGARQTGLLIGVERERGAHLRDGLGPQLGGLGHEGVDDGRQVMGPAGSDHEDGHGRGQLVGPLAEQLLDDAGAALDGDGRIGQGRAQRVAAFERAGQLEELVLDATLHAFGPGHFEERGRVGVDPVGHR